MTTRFQLFALVIAARASASTLYDYDERAIHLANALGKCPVEFQVALRSGATVSQGRFAAPRPADPNVYRETHTLMFSTGRTLRIVAVTRRGAETKYDCVLE